jgi:hypothetical protein
MVLSEDFFEVKEIDAFMLGLRMNIEYFFLAFSCFNWVRVNVILPSFMLRILFQKGTLSQVNYIVTLSQVNHNNKTLKHLL